MIVVAPFAAVDAVVEVIYCVVDDAATVDVEVMDAVIVDDATPVEIIMRLNSNKIKSQIES